MGACFDSRVYQYDDRQKIGKAFAQACSDAKVEDGCSYPGTIAAFSKVGVWKDKSFPSLDAAEEWLEENHEKWEEATAVSFFLPDAKGKPSKNKGWVVGGWCSS